MANTLKIENKTSTEITQLYDFDGGKLELFLLLLEITTLYSLTLARKYAPLKQRAHLIKTERS
jgi:hypothetical protein